MFPHGFAIAMGVGYQMAGFRGHGFHLFTCILSPHPVCKNWSAICVIKIRVQYHLKMEKETPSLKNLFCTICHFKPFSRRFCLAIV